MLRVRVAVAAVADTVAAADMAVVAAEAAVAADTVAKRSRRTARPSSPPSEDQTDVPVRVTDWDVSFLADCFWPSLTVPRVAV